MTRSKSQKIKDKVKRKQKYTIPPAKPPVVTSENADTLMSSFIKYYKALNLVAEEEWDDFFKSMLTPLPSTFRFAENHRQCINRFEGMPGCVGQAAVLRDFFKETILPSTEGVEMRTGPFQAGPLSTFPNDMVWQCNTGHKSMLNKLQLKKMRAFMFEEERGSFLFKQEVTNMVGPWLVDILPDDKILELCCAPGNQSALIAERLHADNKRPADGFLLCNDVDKNQLNYRWTLGTNTMFTHENAAKFPDLYTTPEHEPDSKVEYDLIFLDAPSSQDGSFRQKPDTRGVWDMNAAHACHKKLKPMLKRAVELVAVNGKVVFSTASFNPVENEAVVAEIMRQAKGSLELVDVSDQLKDFKTRPGMDTWKIWNATMIQYADYASTPTWFKKDHDESAFPPTSEESEEFQLNRCMRILPHDNNTGGAFYAVIKKIAPLPVPEKPDVTTEEPEVMDTEGAEGAGKDGDKKADDEDAADGNKGEEVTEDGDGQDKKPTSKRRRGGKSEMSRSQQRRQERKLKNVSYDVFLTVTEIDWATEVTDESLNTETDVETVKYIQPGLKVTKSFVRSFYGEKSDHLFSRFEDVDTTSPELQFLSNAYGLDLSALEPNLMAGVHGLKGTRYFYTSTLVKKIVQSNQIYFQHASAHAAGFYIMMEAVDRGEMAIQPLLPRVLDIKKRLVPVTKDDLIALLSTKTVSITALTAPTQTQLNMLDDKGPVYFIYQPKGPNADPKCPLLLKREKVKVFIEDNYYSKIENCHHLRLCGVDAFSHEAKQNEEEPMEEEEENTGEEKEEKPKEEEAGI